MHPTSASGLVLVARQDKTRQDKPRRQCHCYSTAFKASVLAQTREPGASVPGVALSHGLHPNMVHRWLREQHLDCEQGQPQRPAFVPLSIPAVVADDHIVQPMATALTQASGDGRFIRIEVQPCQCHHHDRLAGDGSSPVRRG